MIADPVLFWVGVVVVSIVAIRLVIKLFFNKNSDNDQYKQLMNNTLNENGESQTNQQIKGNNHRDDNGIVINPKKNYHKRRK